MLKPLKATWQSASRIEKRALLTLGVIIAVLIVFALGIEVGKLSLSFF